MLNASWNHKAVASARVKGLISSFELNVPADDVHQLFMRMTVSGANPSFFHKVTHQHQLAAISEHLSRQTRLR